MKRFILIILFCKFSLSISALAWGGLDPARVAAIELCSKEAKDALEAQQKAQLLNTTGHVWIKEEVEMTRKFQEQFNSYLDAFQNVLNKCVQIYGIYYEVNRCTKTIGILNRTVAEAPNNALAVAFSANRTKFYRNVIDASIEIVGDIKIIVLDSKMTEHERFKIIESIQPKLRNLNILIRRLAIAIKYTTLADVWREIEGRSYTPKTRLEICRKCQEDWSANYRRLKR